MEAPVPGDAVHIEELELAARIGVPDAERAREQRLTVSLTLWPERDFRDLGDDIENALNYVVVCAAVKGFVARRADRLIETLADALAAELLGAFPLRRVDLELRKFILRDTRHVSVQVSRTRG